MVIVWKKHSSKVQNVTRFYLTNGQKTSALSSMKKKWTKGNINYKNENCICAHNRTELEVLFFFLGARTFVLGNVRKRRFSHTKHDTKCEQKLGVVTLICVIFVLS